MDNRQCKSPADFHRVRDNFEYDKLNQEDHHSCNQPKIIVRQKQPEHFVINLAQEVDLDLDEILLCWFQKSLFLLMKDQALHHYYNLPILRMKSKHLEDFESMLLI